MSSIFGASGSESSVDSSVDDSNVEVSGPSSSRNHEGPPESMPGGSPITADTGALSRAIAANFQLPNLQPHQHSALFYLSLIEGRCKTQAARSINAGRSPDDQLPENHPEVCELAEHLFAEMSKELHKVGILPNEYAGQNLAALRKSYLSSFDAILNNIAAKQNHDIPTHSAYRALDKSDFFSLSRDANTTSLEISRAIAPQNLTMAPLPHHYLLTGDSTIKRISPSEYFTKYKQLSLLGKGGFGHVYKVLDILDDQVYAVKRIVIPSERLSLINSEDKKAEVLKELRTLAKLQHRNVVRYHHSWIEVFPSPPKKALDKARDSR
jgi:translation initiation factor 2-alpha kinase 3